MPRGLNSTVTTELGNTTFGLPIYCARITRAPDDVLYWAERDLSFNDGSVDYVDDVLDKTPNLYLRFGEAVTSPITTVAADSSGNAQNGTYHNAPTLGIAGALSGDSNTAVTLNGSNQYITVPTSAFVNPGDTHSIEFWFKAASFAFPQKTLVDKGTNGYNIAIAVGGTIIYSKAGTGTIAQSTSGLTTNTWHYVVITKAGSDVHIYIDGVDVTGTVTNQTIASTGTDLYIGQLSGGGANIAGTLDELAIYPVVLTPEEVLFNYNAGLGVIAYEARLMSLSGLSAIPDQAGPISLVAANVDGAVTTLDRDVSFRGAFVEILAYLPTSSPPTYYKMWSGWSDEISEISQESATLIAYPTIFIPNVQVPKRTIGLPCTNTFGNFANWSSTIEFEGSECPYRRVSTIGFAAALVGDITTGDATLTILWTSALVTAGAKFQKGDRIKIDNEIMLITVQPADPDGSFEQSIQVFRGYLDTATAAHLDTSTVLFNNCGYAVADCTRRGMYGNNTSDSYTV